MPDQMDNLLSKLGTGKWHLFHILTIGYSVSFPSPHALGGAFLAPRHEYSCDIPHHGADETNLHVNLTNQDSCIYFAKNQHGEVAEEICTKWVFDNSTFTQTVTSDFELVCEKEYLRATYQSMYMLGVLVGSPINGLAADRFGRKTIYVGGCILFTIMAIVSSWMPNLPSLLAFRFLLGTMHPTLLKTGYILAVEISAPKVRSAVGVIYFVPWAFGTMAWAGLAYLVRSWRWLQLYASLPCLIVLPALWFIDESPRWLCVRGQHHRALQVLKKAARWNNVDLPSDSDIICLLKESQSAFPKSKTVEKSQNIQSVIMYYIKSAFILYRTPRLCFINLITHLDFFVYGMVYFGLALSASNFKFDAFTYMALMGLMEVPACLSMAPLVDRYGRKMPIAVSCLITGVVLLVLPFLPTESLWAVVMFAMVGKMTITMAFQSGNLFGSELLPTEVRTRGLSTSFMLSRVGSSISPFITEYLGVSYPWAPSVVFGAAAIVAGLATLMLWETLGMALPDTIAQLESNDFKPPKRYLNIPGRIPGSKAGSLESEAKVTRDDDEELTQLHENL